MFYLLLPVPSQLFLAFGIGHEPIQDALGIWQSGPVCIRDVLILCSPAVVPVVADSLWKREKKSDFRGIFCGKRVILRDILWQKNDVF